MIESHPATEIVLPADCRLEFSRRGRGRCRCGWTIHDHPICSACGVLIGPRHLERFGKPVPVDIYADTFDDTRGMWYITKRSEMRYICLGCATDGVRSVAPFRQAVRPGRRLARMNAWRRRNGLEAVDLSPRLIVVEE